MDTLDGSSLADLFNLYLFPAGRASYAAASVAALAREGGHGRIEAAAGRVVEAAGELQDMELRWKVERVASSPTHSPAAAATDAELDRVLGAIAGTAQNLLAGLAGDDPLALRAGRFIEAALPGGPAPIVRLSYEEELVAVQRLIPRLRGELAADVAALGLGHYVDRLEQLAARFATELHAGKRRAVSFDQVSSARIEVEEAVGSLVATIVGEFPGRSREHIKERVALLAPIMTQNEALRRQRQRRKAVTDVDPATGLEVDPDAAGPAATEPTPQPVPEPVA